jgi:hypothetical protein
MVTDGPEGLMTIVTSASTQVMARLPAAAAVLLGVAALAVVAVPGFWVLVRHIDVMAHEGAHAMVGSVLDTRVTGVRVKSDGTGDTVIHTAAGSGFIVALVGYLGPSGFGLAAAALIARGLIVPVLWIGVVLLAILLPSLRNAFGIAVVIGTGFLLLSIARSRNPGLEEVTAYGLSWLLLLCGVRSVLEHRAEAGDAYKLRKITSLPRGL